MAMIPKDFNVTISFPAAPNTPPFETYIDVAVEIFYDPEAREIQDLTIIDSVEKLYNKVLTSLIDQLTCHEDYIALVTMSPTEIYNLIDAAVEKIVYEDAGCLIDEDMGRV